MNFLDLCQKAITWSDTGHAGQITETNQSIAPVFQSQVIDFVREAWREIQQERPWGWMIEPVSFYSVEDKEEYAWNEALDEDGNRVIESFTDWYWKSDEPWYVDRNNEGTEVSENYLTCVRWQRFRNVYIHGLRSQKGIPQLFSISHKNNVWLHPKPKGAYKITGQYHRGAQELSENGDTPYGIPEQYHPIIAWKAVMKLHEIDEKYGAMQVAERRYKQYWYNLAKIYLDPIRFARPIA